MSKQTIILVFAIILTGCSVMRRGKISADLARKDSLELTEQIVAMNITENDFNVPKAEIEILSNGNEQKLLASMKYRKPDMYLLSIRNRTGIEAARIFVTKDTLMINDRMDRKLYCGSTEYLFNKYGISASALPLITGDLLNDIKTGSEKITCKDNKGTIEGHLQQKRISYIIDCTIAKVVNAIISDENHTAGIELKYSNFKEAKKYKFPGLVEIEDFMKQTSIRIDISEIEFDVEDKIEFIPGKNYEKILMK